MIKVINMYNPTADIAAEIAAKKVAEAARIARSAAAATMFALDDRNQFRLVIDGYPIQEVKSATLMLSVDCAADGFTAVIPYHEELAMLRDPILAPPAYPTAEVYLGGKKRFTGKLYQRKCKFGHTGKYRTLIGWSPIADALDSTITPPYESNMMTLTAHATRLLAPFGLVVKWMAGADVPFTRIKCEKDEKIGDNLFRLARERGVFIMSDTEGFVTFHQPTANLPVAMFTEGLPPFDEAEIDLDGRKWFGQHVCYGTHPRGNKQATAIDDRFPISRRTVINSPEGSDMDMKTAAEWAARKSFGEGIEFSHGVPSWYTSALPVSDVWLPNTLVRVTSPTAFLKNGFDFLIRSVEYRWDEKEGARATLDFVSPTAYLTMMAQKTNAMSWKARMMLQKAVATPLEKILMDEPGEPF
jgi:prophage tail gpP-like protein